MQRRFRIITCTVASTMLALLVLTPSGGALPPSGTVVDLGTLGGTNSVAYGVSGSIVVGEAQTAGGAKHAFVYDLAAATPQMVDLGTLGGTNSVANGVSGSIVVGEAQTAGGAKHAFVYDLAAATPQMVDLGTLGGTNSRSWGVSGSIVVGSAETAGGVPHAFVYNLAAATPQMVDLAPLGEGSFASAVSGSIVVGGMGTGHAFMYDLAAATPQMVDLGIPDNRPGNSALGVSGSIVVGISQGGGLRERAWAYDLAADPPQWVDLGTLGWYLDVRQDYSLAYGVSGSIVVGEVAPGVAFVYDLAAATPQMVDLSIPLGAPNSTARGVSGNIVVGDAYTADFTADRAFAYVLPPSGPVDGDGDGIPDAQDNCPATANPGQVDTDHDSLGDPCDPDANGDGVLDLLQPSGTPAGSFVDNALVPSTTGTVLSGSVTVVDAADPAKGVVVTAGSGGAVLSPVCGSSFEVEIPAGGSLTITCHSIEITNVSGGPVKVTVAGGAVVTFPSDTGGTVNTTLAGGASVTGVTGDGVTLAAGGVTTPIGPSGSLNLIVGTGRNEKLTGTDGDDMIVGKGGNDQIDGKGGNDTIIAGSGNDTIDGGAGDDTIDAGGGNNAVDGGTGNDAITAGGGNDKITSGTGNNTIDAGGGNNIVNAGAGNDAITAGSGNDDIDGGPGTDTCAPGGGNNKVKNCETIT